MTEVAATLLPRSSSGHSVASLETSSRSLVDKRELRFAVRAA